MDPIVRQAKQIIEKAVIEAYPQLAGNCPPISIAPPSPKLEVPADYTCTSAMQLNKLLSKSTQADGTPAPSLNPIQVAEAIVAQLNGDKLAVEFNQLFERLTVTKPGFINFLVKTEYASSKILELIKQGSVEIKHQGSGRVVVDYSSPNIAKEMHVGHLRSTIIGDCVARLLEYAHYDVLRLNHIGDWGTQFGMLLALLFDRFGEDYTKFTNEISDLQNFYKEAKKRFDEDEEFKERSYKKVVELQSQEPKAIEAWKHICDISRREFKKIYERLGIEKLIERGESFYQKDMELVVQDLDDREFIITEDGRKVLWPNDSRKKNDIPLTIVKSDGGFTYDTSDLAALKQRVCQEKAKRILYVADNGQALHFQNVFNAARRTNYAGDAKLEHVGFGLVLGEDKKKFKTRSGDTVKLADLLDEGLQRSRAKLLEKKRDAELSEQEMRDAQEAVAYGCIKYADLSRDRNKDYVFSFDQMLEDKGNTAVYLLYTLTRIRSIKRKANLGSVEDILRRRDEEAQVADSKASDRLELTHEKEIKLAKYLLKFPDIILQCIDDLLFHLLCNYLYDLSGVFTDFYEACYCIERSGDQIVKINYDRILLCEASAMIMDKGLNLLGLKTLSRM